MMMMIIKKLKINTLGELSMVLVTQSWAKIILSPVYTVSSYVHVPENFNRRIITREMGSSPVRRLRQWQIQQQQGWDPVSDDECKSGGKPPWSRPARRSPNRELSLLTSPSNSKTSSFESSQQILYGHQGFWAGKNPFPKPINTQDRIWKHLHIHRADVIARSWINFIHRFSIQAN